MPSGSAPDQIVDNIVPPTASNNTANTTQIKKVEAGASTLTLCLLARTNDDKDRYAIIPLPESYEAAKVAALKVLDSLSFRHLIKTVKEEWVWADISAEIWSLVASNGGEFGVVEIPRKVIYEEGFYFKVGKLRYTVGKHTGSKTQWTTIVDSNFIDRPRNYEQATQFVRHALIGTYSSSGLYKESDLNSFTFHAIQEVLTEHKGKEVVSWLDFPPIAYKSDVAWRTVVPISGGILGIIINSVLGWEHGNPSEISKGEVTTVW